MSRDRTRSFDERREQPRHTIRLDVNYRHGDNYLFSRSSNLSEMGIFLVTDAPMSTGTKLELRFAVQGDDNPIEVMGVVVWIDPGTDGAEPGMGIRFLDPSEDTKRRVKALIRTMAYLE